MERGRQAVEQYTHTLFSSVYLLKNFTNHTLLTPLHLFPSLPTSPLNLGAPLCLSRARTRLGHTGSLYGTFGGEGSCDRFSLVVGVRIEGKEARDVGCAGCDETGSRGKKEG